VRRGEVLPRAFGGGVLGVLDLCGERGKWSVGGAGFWWESVNWAPGMDAVGGGLGLQGFRNLR
jgi:hypothetical protein